MIKFTPSIFIFLSTMITSTLMVLSSPNWFLAWMAMELNLMSFIPLMLNTKSNQEAEASIKYFLAQALGSAMMLMGSFSQWSITPSAYLSILILMIALLLKLGMAPCHFWFPSVMTSISWMNALILSTWQKLAPLLLLTFPLSGNTLLQSMIGVLAAMNAILGGSMGMNQTHLRTLLAYSAISHSGWMISALKINMPNVTFLYFILYSLVITPLFMFMMLISTSSQLVSLFNRGPLISTTLCILLMSLAGLPPFTGFIPKLLIIFHLSGHHLILVLALLMGSFMSTYYYLSITFNIISAQLSLSAPNKKIKTNTSPLIVIMGASSMLGILPIMIYALTLLN